ncbi:MAG: hypothetical protein E7265_06620, partial [Lachnospiraceae bacterium]|nr:hypothetical protein [Lachnospiraceae bacterium]
MSHYEDYLKSEKRRKGGSAVRTVSSNNKGKTTPYEDYLMSEARKEYYEERKKEDNIRSLAKEAADFTKRVAHNTQMGILAEQTTTGDPFGDMIIDNANRARTASLKKERRSIINKADSTHMPSYARDIIKGYVNEAGEAEKEWDELSKVRASRNEAEKNGNISSDNYGRRLESVNNRISAIEEKYDNMTPVSTQGAQYDYFNRNKNADKNRELKDSGLLRLRDKIMEDKKEAEEYEYYASIPYRSDYAAYKRIGEHNPDNNAINYDIGILDQMEGGWFDNKSDYDYANMTDEEKGIYSYLVGKEGVDKAEKFRDYIQYTLTDRRAQAIADNVGSDPFVAAAYGFGNAITNALVRVPQKIANAITGDSALASTPQEMAMDKIKNNLVKDWPQITDNHSLMSVGYDLTYNVGNMLPSIAASYATGGVAGAILGSATMGANAGATGFNDAWLKGHGKKEATVYGISKAILEGGLQYALGGISKLGAGKSGLVKVAGKLSDKVKTVTGKAMVNFAGQGAGEFTEEYLQEVIDPVVQNITLGENNDVRFFTSDALYAGILGAMSAGVLDVGSSQAKANNDMAISEIGREIVDDGSIEDYVTYAEPVEEIGKVLKAYKDNPSMINAGRLRIAVEDSIGKKMMEASNKEELDQVNEEMTETLPDTLTDVVKEAYEDVETGFVEQNDMSEEIVLNDADISAGRIAEQSVREDMLSDTYNNLPDKMKEVIVNSESDSGIEPEVYRNAMADYYENARLGQSLEAINRTSVYNNALTNTQAQYAYNEGVKARDDMYESMEANVPVRRNKGKGVVRYINQSEMAAGITAPVNFDKMEIRQKNSVRALRTIARATGFDFALYRSEAVNGRVTAPNGWYNSETDTIYIDVNSGDVGEMAMLRTASHEITHSIKEWSPKKYRELQDYIINQFESDESLEVMIGEEIRKAKSNNHNMTREEALDEVTANACEMMLRDSKAIIRLADENPGLIDKIKNVIDNLVNNIKKAFAGLGSGSLEHKRMSEILEDWTSVQKMWDDALV